uniref:30S ribosomal protein 3, chloroplastic n=2 Tax=Quercus lobata TaxID=97700 RepID=A0A7N2KQG3_QUELO
MDLYSVQDLNYLSAQNLSFNNTKMLSSMAVQPGVNTAFFSSSFSSQIPSLRPFKTSPFVTPNAFSLHPCTIIDQRNKPFRRNQNVSVSAAPEALTVETPSETESSTSTSSEEPNPTKEIEKTEVVVKPVETPRLVLKFIWMEKNIGLALDQVIPGHGTIPLSPYYFWPRKDAWEELKTTLESKPWISQKKMIILLNQATDIINLWQQSAGNPTS